MFILGVFTLFNPTWFKPKIKFLAKVASANLNLENDYFKAVTYCTMLRICKNYRLYSKAIIFFGYRPPRTTGTLLKLISYTKKVEVIKLRQKRKQRYKAKQKKKDINRVEEVNTWEERDSAPDSSCLGKP